MGQSEDGVPWDRDRVEREGGKKGSYGEVQKGCVEMGCLQRE